MLIGCAMSKMGVGYCVLIGRAEGFIDISSACMLTGCVNRMCYE